MVVFLQPYDTLVEVYNNPSILSLTADTICDDNTTTFEFDLVLISDTNITHSWNYGDLNTSNNLIQYINMNI